MAAGLIFLLLISLHLCTADENNDTNNSTSDGTEHIVPSPSSHTPPPATLTASPTSNGTPQSRICSGSVSRVNPPLPSYTGDAITTTEGYGKLSSNSSSCHWKIACPDTAYLIAVVMAADMAPGDYLQLNRTIKFSECIDQPAGYMFKKKSIVVGTANESCDSTSTFEVLFCCCVRSLCQQASQIILNQDVLRYIQQHETAFNKVAALHVDPGSVGLEGLQDPELTTMLDLAGLILRNKK